MDTPMLEFVIGHANYWLFILLMMTGLYIVIAKGNLVKKIVGLNIFQTSVFMLYISMGKIAGGTAPIFPLDLKVDPDTLYSNPLPHVLILTAIVVGVATTSLGLALIIRIREEYHNIEEAQIAEAEEALFQSEIKASDTAMKEAQRAFANPRNSGALRRGTPDCVHWPPRSGLADRLYCQRRLLCDRGNAVKPSD